MHQRLVRSREVRLQFMDDFCKQTNIFTNKDDALKHRIEHSRKLHGVYETSLENATKNFAVLPEVFGMDDFLKPLPRDDDEKKKQKLLQAQSLGKMQPQAKQQITSFSKHTSAQMKEIRMLKQTSFIQNCSTQQSQPSRISHGEERRKEEERLQLLEQYERDRGKFNQELEGLDKVLQEDSLKNLV